MGTRRRARRLAGGRGRSRRWPLGLLDGSGGPTAVVRSAPPAAADGRHAGHRTGGDGTGGQMDPDGPTVDEPITPMDDVTVMGSAGGPQQRRRRDAGRRPGRGGVLDPHLPRRLRRGVRRHLEGGFWTYGPDTPSEDLPPCPGVTSYDDIAQNAFYCPDADLIAWDREAPGRPVHRRVRRVRGGDHHGPRDGPRSSRPAPATSTPCPGVITELQADCFAGSWIADVVDGGSEDFEADIDSARPGRRRPDRGPRRPGLGPQRPLGPRLRLRPGVGPVRRHLRGAVACADLRRRTPRWSPRPRSTRPTPHRRQPAHRRAAEPAAARPGRLLHAACSPARAGVGPGRRRHLLRPRHRRRGLRQHHPDPGRGRLQDLLLPRRRHGPDRRGRPGAHPGDHRRLRGGAEVARQWAFSAQDQRASTRPTPRASSCTPTA